MAKRDCSKRARARAHDRGIKAFAAFNRRCERKLQADDWRKVAQAAFDKTLSGPRRRRRRRR